MDLLLQLVGGFAIIAVGVVFMAGGTLGNSMPALLSGATVTAVGVVVIVNKFITDVIAVPVKTYSMTLSIDNTTLLTLLFTIVVCVAAPFVGRWWLNK